MRFSRSFAAASPGFPSPIGMPSSETTGITSRTDDDVKASLAAPSRYRRARADSGSGPMTVTYLDFGDTGLHAELELIAKTLHPAAKGVLRDAKRGGKPHDHAVVGQPLARIDLGQCNASAVAHRSPSPSAIFAVAQGVGLRKSGGERRTSHVLSGSLSVPVALPLAMNPVVWIRPESPVWPRGVIFPSTPNE